MARPGRYGVSGKSTAADGRSFDACGTITLHHDGSVSGMLTDGPLAGGSWNGSQLSFLLVYNAEVPFLYSLRIRRAKKTAQNAQRPSVDAVAGSEPVRCKGSWQRDGPRGLEDSCHGTLKLQLIWQADIPPPARPSPSDSTAADAWANVTSFATLPLPGDDGNRACEVRPVTALSVPCSMCSEEQANLSFFDMVVPHFGTAELVSFSCAACGYKYNKVGTAVGQRAGPTGKTIRLRVSSDADLKREVVISDVATVRLAAVELEVQAVGRYTTVEGLITGLAAGLAQAALVRASDAITAGPSAPEDTVACNGGLRGAVSSLENRIQDLIDGCAASPFTVEISDPLALSFIADLPIDQPGAGANADIGPDSAPADLPQSGEAKDRPSASGGSLEIENWPRSPEDDLELGLIDATEAGEMWAAAAEGETTAALPALRQENIKCGEENLTSELDTYVWSRSVFHGALQYLFSSSA